LSNGVAEAGEGELVDGGRGVRYGYDGLGGIHDAIPENSVQPNRHAVPGDGLLPLGGDGPRADVDDHRPLNSQRADPEQTGSAQTLETSKPEHHAALILLSNAKSGNEYDDYNKDDGQCNHE